MADGLTLINSWGFSYVSGFPWLKIKDVSRDMWGKLEVRVRYGIGHWFRGCSEAILLARRGNVSPPSGNFTGILCSSLVHSRKPKSIYEYAETLDGPYLELFARSKRKGWVSWGNEVETPEDPNLAAIFSNHDH
jgi:N6-adenosine-specific RNA methylase IME4